MFIFVFLRLKKTYAVKKDDKALEKNSHQKLLEQKNR